MISYIEIVDRYRSFDSIVDRYRSIESIVNRYRSIDSIVDRYRPIDWAPFGERATGGGCPTFSRHWRKSRGLRWVISYIAIVDRYRSIDSIVDRYRSIDSIIYRNRSIDSIVDRYRYIDSIVDRYRPIDSIVDRYRSIESARRTVGERPQWAEALQLPCGAREDRGGCAGYVDTDT